MSNTNCSLDPLKHEDANFPVSKLTKTPPLHRLGEVRRQEEISRRTVARRLGIDVATVEIQECGSTDIPLSVLYEWQKALDVPIVELLEEPNDSLSTPLVKRAQSVRLMKTALSIFENAKQKSIRRMAQTLINQLIETMPELRDVNSWHIVGRRRRRNEYGRAAEHSLPDEMFMERGE